MSKIALDYLYLHSEDIGETVGDFHGTSIRAWDAAKTAQRAYSDTLNIIQENLAAAVRLQENKDVG